jgi:ribosomal protein S15P/S13E
VKVTPEQVMMLSSRMEGLEQLWREVYGDLHNMDDRRTLTNRLRELQAAVRSVDRLVFAMAEG